MRHQVYETPSRVRREQAVARMLKWTVFLGAMLHTVAAPMFAQCGAPSKEYVRMGGRVIAIENYPQLAAPSLPPNGALASLTLTPPSGGTVYYTTDSSTPSCAGGGTTQSSTIPKNIPLQGTVTVKALYTQPGYRESAVSTGTYILGASSATLSPSSADFGYQVSQTGSSPTVFTLSNNGTLPLTNVSIQISQAGPFTLSHSCPSTLAVNGSCPINVAFHPTGTAVAAPTVTVTHSGGTVSSTLRGTEISATTAAFGPHAISSSTTQTVTLKNSGSATLAVTGASITSGAPFSQSNTCGSVVPAGSCQLTVTFAPTAANTWTSTMSIADNAAGSPHAVTLSGNTGLSMTPAALSFTNCQVGSTCGPQTVTVNNYSGSSAGTTASVSTGEYSAATSCPATLATGSNCTISVSFTPAASGARNATLSISGATNSVALGGNATPKPTRTFSPQSINFGSVAVGSTATATVTVTNTSAAGGPNLTVGNGRVTDPTEFWLTNTCDGNLIPPQGQCTYTIVYAPASAGAHTDTFTFGTDANQPLDSVPLSGGAVNQLQPPTFSSNGGAVLDGTTVTITAPSGASILYTTDGTTPGSSGTAQLVASPLLFTIHSTVVINAVSHQAGYVDSPVVTTTYYLGGASFSPTYATIYTGRFTSDAATVTSPNPSNTWTGASANAINLFFSDVDTGAMVCTVSYVPLSSIVYLNTDNGIVAGTLGVGPVLSNGRCMVNLAGASAQLSGVNAALTVPIAFTPSCTGLLYVTVSAPLNGVSATWVTNQTINANPLTISPTSKTLQAGEMQSFTANSTVNWSRSPQLGALTSAGLYQAPASVSAGQVVLVTATSQSDSTSYVTAPVTLSPGVPADLYLTNLTILNGSPTYRASNSVTGATNVVIGGTAHVTFSAGSVVKLEPGFSTTAAGSGTTFHAVIE
jgi:hypothetical protein